MLTRSDEFTAEAGDTHEGNLPKESISALPVFAASPPRSPEDAKARFAGAVHVRAVPPHLEKVKDQKLIDEYDRFVADMTSFGKKKRFWECVANAASGLDPLEDDHHRTLFLATDSAGLRVGKG